MRLEGVGAAYECLILPPVEEEPTAEAEGEPAVPVSVAGAEIRAHLLKPAASRTPVDYNRAFLDSYRPNDR